MPDSQPQPSAGDRALRHAYRGAQGPHVHQPAEHHGRQQHSIGPTAQRLPARPAPHGQAVVPGQPQAPGRSSAAPRAGCGVMGLGILTVIAFAGHAHAGMHAKRVSACRRSHPTTAEDGTARRCAAWIGSSVRPPHTAAEPSPAWSGKRKRPLLTARAF